ncbi:MAG TPA: prolipoprotein diacylglyceryl transferase [Bacteroidales bacterium]|nr:prolipoprotein diacylglyceryl transferase [Bacteroidales bacterium]HPE57938.1 prolipoprotein diacylglyceryl transferase [Bacteroidales bacterium]HRX97363.1 prolipoprotein diacylglyceryl transferase [Bacteroidales bacterium]
MLDAIVWNVKPEIFSIGSLSIRYYGLLFALGFVFGYIIMNYIFKKEGNPQGVLDTLTTYMVIATVVGARLGHCLFYEPEYYLAHPIDILKVWEGGLASHGAGVGIIFSLWLFSRKTKKPLLWILDRIVIVVALAGFFIRMGNLMNSEIYGIQTDLPWGFIFERRDELVPKHPTQIYEALFYLVIFLVLFFIYRKKGVKIQQGLLFGLFLVTLFSVRFLIEFIKEPQVGFEENMVLNMGQILSIPFIILGIYMLIRSQKKKIT